jgi:hypothetical protein
VSAFNYEPGSRECASSACVTGKWRIWRLQRPTLFIKQLSGKGLAESVGAESAAADRCSTCSKPSLYLFVSSPTTMLASYYSDYYNHVTTSLSLFRDNIAKFGKRSSYSQITNGLNYSAYRFQTLGLWVINEASGRRRRRRRRW